MGVFSVVFVTAGQNGRSLLAEVAEPELDYPIDL